MPAVGVMDPNNPFRVALRTNGKAGGTKPGIDPATYGGKPDMNPLYGGSGSNAGMDGAKPTMNPAYGGAGANAQTMGSSMGPSYGGRNGASPTDKGGYVPPGGIRPQPMHPPIGGTKPGPGGVTDPPQPGGGPGVSPAPMPMTEPGGWTPGLRARAALMLQRYSDPTRMANMGRRPDGSINYDPAIYGSNYRGTNMGAAVPGAGTPDYANGGLTPYQWVEGRGWVQPVPGGNPLYPGGSPGAGGLVGNNWPNGG